MEVLINKYVSEYRGALDVGQGPPSIYGELWTCPGEFYDSPDRNDAFFIEIEERYWGVIDSIADYLSLSHFHISNVYHDNRKEYSSSEDPLLKEAVEKLKGIDIKEGLVLEIRDLRFIFSAVFRGVLDAKVGGGPLDFFIHFGYDCYVYCGANCDFKYDPCGLTVRKWTSPYHEDAA